MGGGGDQGGSLNGGGGGPGFGSIVFKETSLCSARRRGGTSFTCESDDHVEELELEN